MLHVGVENDGRRRAEGGGRRAEGGGRRADGDGRVVVKVTFTNLSHWQQIARQPLRFASWRDVLLVALVLVFSSEPYD